MTVLPDQSSGETIQSARWNVLLNKIQKGTDTDVIIASTVADGGNKPNLTLVQNDVTNNPQIILLTNAGTGASIDDGTASWSADFKLAGFAEISATVLTDGAFSVNAGAVTGMTTASMSGALTNTLAIGSAPFVITSTTKVSNLHVARATLADTVTIADESADTTCYINYVTAATGDLAIKTGTNLIFNSSTGQLEATILTNGTVTITGADITGVANMEVTETITFDLEYDNGNSGAADTVDWGKGNKQKSTMTDDCTYTFTAPDGPCNVMLKLIQDGTETRVPTWPGTVKWPGGTEPTWSTAASAVDMISFYYDGTNYYGSAAIAMA